jgi:hypothetical protein
MHVYKKAELTEQLRDTRGGASLTVLALTSLILENLGHSSHSNAIEKVILLDKLTILC